MEVKLISCFFVLDSEKNDNIRKNDIQKVKVLVTKNKELPSIDFDGTGMKKQLKKYLSNIVNTDIFHLEQVFTMDDQNGVRILYLGITNIENIINLKEDYQLIDFKVKDNNTITFGEESYQYQTVEVEGNNNIEYFHKIDVDDIDIRRTLLSLLISYKKIRGSVDSSDILFKFMGSSFSLEDVRILYETIKDSTVDKSNFRKKIVKYCEKIETKEQVKSGFRPSQKYRFKPLKEDIWI